MFSHHKRTVFHPSSSTSKSASASPSPGGLSRVQLKLRLSTPINLPHFILSKANKNPHSGNKEVRKIRSDLLPLYAWMRTPRIGVLWWRKRTQTHCISDRFRGGSPSSSSSFVGLVGNNIMRISLSLSRSVYRPTDRPTGNRQLIGNRKCVKVAKMYMQKWRNEMK